MELFRDALFLKGVQLIVIIFAGILFVVLGYKLFLYGVDKGRGKLKAHSETYKIIFSGSGPGLFFMIFGGFVIFFSIISGGALRDARNLKGELSNTSEQLVPTLYLGTDRVDNAATNKILPEGGLPNIPDQPALLSGTSAGKSGTKRRIKGTLGTANVIGKGSKAVNRGQEELSRVINNHNAAIEYCYKKEAKANPTLKGNIEVEFTISYKGRVIAVRIIRSSMQNKSIENCISSRIKGWQFKPIDQKDGDVKVRQKYIFG